MKNLPKKLFGTLAAFFAAACFFALPAAGDATIRANNFVSAAESDETGETEPPQTEKFEDPFERAEGMQAENLGAKFDEDEEPFGDGKALLSLFLIGAAAAAAVIAVVIIRKKNRRKTAQKSTAAARHNLSEAEAFIRKNPTLYADVQDMIRTRKCRFIYAQDDGIFFQDDDGFYENGTFVLAAKDEAAARKIILLCPEEYGKIKESALVCHGEKQADFCRDFFGFDRITKCFQTTYTPPEPLPLKGALRFEKAGEKQLQTIIDTYDKESPESLKKLVAAKKINCAYAKDADEDGNDIQADTNGETRENFVGYIGQHPEGSMGLLLIFPEYRRHGYAEEAESYQINEIIAEGRTPYAHIITDNFKSFSLQKKLGANVADELVIWMSRSDRKKD